jgi:SAM-dependent methyltransferase
MAESFGVDAVRYDRTRPPYPAALIERIAGAGTAVLDVGCGTGIVARQLRAAGCAVLGVEPDGRMAEFARGTGVEVETGTFEEWEPGGRSFDAVVSGQAWHWVDPVAGAAKAAGVLRPGGLVALFWHVYEPPASVSEALAEVFERLVPESPVDVRATMPRAGEMYRAGLDSAAAALDGTGSFRDIERWEFGTERTYTRAQWLDLLPTMGLMTRLPAETGAEIASAVGAAIDELGGSFTTVFHTVTLAARRR